MYYIVRAYVVQVRAKVRPTAPRCASSASLRGRSARIRRHPLQLLMPSPRLGAPTFALRTAPIGDRVSHARGCTGSIRSCGTAIGGCGNAIRLRDPAIVVRIAAIGQGVPVNARGIPADRRCGPVIGLRDPANALRIPTNRHCGRINAPRIPGDRLREVHIGLRIVAICLCVIDLAVRRGSLLRWRLGQGWEPVRRREIAAHPIGLLATTVRMCSPQAPIIS